MEAAREIGVYQGFTNEDIEAVRNVIAPGAPDHIIRLVLYRCKVLGVDPMSKMIYAINRPRKKSGANRPKCPQCTKPLRKGDTNWYCWKKQDGCGLTLNLDHPLVANAEDDREDNWVLQSSIDFFRSMAETTGEYVGQLGPFWCGEDGIWKDVWLSSSAPVAAKVGILRKSFIEPLWSVARFAAYAQVDNEGKTQGLWGKMGDLMSAKCAEALGFRKSFPAKFHGIYIDEEMQQADTQATFVEQKPVEVTPQVLNPAPAAPSASIFAKPDSEMKVAVELADEARVRELGKKLGKLTGAINMDLAKAGDLASLRRSYEEQLAKEPVRGFSPSTHGSSVLPPVGAVVGSSEAAPPEAGENLAPVSDEAQTKAVMVVMQAFCLPGIIELYPSYAEQFALIRETIGRNVDKYSELTVAECQKIAAQVKVLADSLAQDDPGGQDKELLLKLQMACKDTEFVNRIKRSKTFLAAQKDGKTQADALRVARLAFGSNALGYDVASFNNLTNQEMEKLLIAAKNFAKGK